jgi:hypothetical protein
MRRIAIHVLLLAAPLAAAAQPAGRSGDAAVNLLLPAPRLDVASAVGTATPEPPPTAAASGGRTGAMRRRYLVPVLLSAALPGLGEIATGHWWRGLPFVAGDIATWIARAYYLEQGRAWRTKYEVFADQHWNYTLLEDPDADGDRDPGEVWGWQESLRRYYDGQSGPNLDWWDPSDPADSCTCAFVFRDEDRQHYYENIGKYRYYWMGWDDWEYNALDPTNSDSRGHRYEYTRMRIESNDNFDNATSMIVVAMATRFASVVQTVLLVRGDGRRAGGWSLGTAKLSGRGAGLELRYRY